MAKSFDPLEALDRIKNNYRTYVSSFQKFKNPAIREWIDERIDEGTLLYKGPYIEINRRFSLGDPFDKLVEDGLLHPDTPSCFTVDVTDSSSSPVTLYKHQSDAIRSICKDNNTIISTGTGSGKSFCFGIPVVSKCLKMKEQGIHGIKAIFIYPMNALANSQYDDFSQRLNGSGLKIAIYTGDTPSTRDEALRSYQERTGREEPYDSEILSREEIQNSPPDILITNYVMLEYILTRFEDKVLFPLDDRGVLKFLVLDEIHTYTGKQGADVAYLIRRLKQHTGTIRDLRCIGTSATVQSSEEEKSNESITKFATKLFGETFSSEAVIEEHYAPLTHEGEGILPENVLVTSEMIDGFEDSPESLRFLVEALMGQPLELSDASKRFMGEFLGKQKTIQFIEEKLSDETLDFNELIEKYHDQIRPDNTIEESRLEIMGAFLAGMHTEIDFNGQRQHRIIPKIHTFFSQGREIKSCLSKDAPHLNDAGEVTCPNCAQNSKIHKTFPMVFCRSCGQEYYSVELLTNGTLKPRELDSVSEEGEAFYLYSGSLEPDVSLAPEKWVTDKRGEVRKEYVQSFKPDLGMYCPQCNKLYLDDREQTTCICSEKVRVSIIPAPFMFCPSDGCGVSYDRRTKKEFSKLFSFGTVGRSTATDVLVSQILNNLPEDEQKVIAFSDNRQDTALQAAHMNNIQKRIHFRRGLYGALKQSTKPVPLNEIGDMIFDVFKDNNAMPKYSDIKEDSMAYSGGEDNAYKEYLRFNAVLELGSTRQKNQPNLEDVGLLKVQYNHLDKLAEDYELWDEHPELTDLSNTAREDYLTGFLDIMRYNTAIGYKYLMNSRDFAENIKNKLNDSVFFHDETRGNRPTGYSDTANTKSWNATVYRLTSGNGNLVKWTKRTLNVDIEKAKEIVNFVANSFKEKDGLKEIDIKYVGKILMLNPDIILFSLSENKTQKVCKKCSSVHHFKELNMCTGPNCANLIEKDFSNNYFRIEYTRNFNEIVPLHAEEHSGQISGEVRKDLETRFKESDGSVNVIVCTPTMELGIDIGTLSAVYMRNVPPSPSNYSQRAGRAGRKSQSSLISTFCGVGSKRGPHDQYFYRYPKDIISGKISVPRFLLNNKTLVKAQIHSLILETINVKIPQKIVQIIDTSKDTLPIYPEKIGDIEEEILGKDELVGTIVDKKDEIINAIQEALNSEINDFEWLDHDYLEHTVNNFVEELDRAFDAFRNEYKSLNKERDEINISMRSGGIDSGQKKSLRIRRASIENKLDEMEKGGGDYMTYRYLAGQGFIPNYGFPTRVTSLSLDYRKAREYEERELKRDRSIALSEYAPGNSIYYSGGRYLIRSSRIKTENGRPITSKLLVCPECETAYLNEENISGGACKYCGADLTDVLIDTNAIEMPDQRAESRKGITSDEEERQRLGYNLSTHYVLSKHIKEYEALIDGEPVLKLTYDHNGRMIKVNRGPVSLDKTINENGFTLCTACSRWITSKTGVKEHLDKNNTQRRCWRGAKEEDIIQNIILYTDSTHDVVTIKCDPPEEFDEEQRESFYQSLAQAIIEGLQISMNIDVDEVKTFLMPMPNEENVYSIILYETAEGGAGILKALEETSTFHKIVDEALRILHDKDPDNGCERACYECLCNYYNQRVHDLLNRKLVLPILKILKEAEIVPKDSSEYFDDDKFNDLMNSCDSNLEKTVLRLIKELKVPLPSHGQTLISDGDEPVAKPDFAYLEDGRSVLVFVDGLDHDSESVKIDDKNKRSRLDLMGYNVFVIRYDEELNDRILELGELIAI